MLHLSIGTARDLDNCLPLLKDLYNNSVYSRVIPYNGQEVKDRLSLVLNGNQEDGCAILLKEDSKITGILICSSMTHLFNSSEKTAVELAFWIRPEKRSFKGLRMLVNAYKFWAKKTKCSTILLGKLKEKTLPETYVLRKVR